jgi:hypothetical protein
MRSMLDDAWDAALAAVVGEAEPDLRTKLRAYETAARKNVASGALASVSANGRTTAFSTNGAQGQDITEGWRDLVDLYDKIKAELSSNDDAEIKTEMMARLVPVTEWENDYSGVCR